jgi:hypothetical protein
MKVLIVCSAAAVFCSVVAIRSALAQGEGYVCDGPFNGCWAVNCLTGSGTCPNTGFAYNYYDLLPNPISTCVPAPNECYPSDLRVACTLHTYSTKGMAGCANFICNIPDFYQYSCPL